MPNPTAITDPLPLPLLYESDETAWLDAMAALVGERRFGEIDHVHLGEYLSDMARRDRREVSSRLVVLLVHLLKWEHQPSQRTGSWRATLLEQRRELRMLLESGTLLNHAETVLNEAYDHARKEVAAATQLPISTFPELCPWDIDSLLSDAD